MSSAVPGFLLVLALLIESFIVKSVVFDRNDPIVAHYLISGLLIGALLVWVAERRSSWETVRRMPGRRIALVMIAWLVIATAMRPSLLEWAALLGFALLLLGFYFVVPMALARASASPRTLVLWLLTVCVLSSVVMLVISPVASYEMPSLRFRGALISVANACNVFFFGCVYFAWAAKYSLGWHRRFFLVLTVVSVALLFLTFTRSSLAQAVVALLVLLSTDTKGRLALIRVVSTGLMAVTAGLGALRMLGTENFIDNFRLADDGLFASRDMVWEEGLARALDNFILGVGLLAKQTKGGSAQLEFSPENYDPVYDAHSLAISLVEQGGFILLISMCLMLTVPLWSYLRTFGFRTALQRPEFLIMAVTVPSMMFAGGDMISLGSLVNRLEWFFLGVLAFEVARVRMGGAIPDRGGLSSGRGIR
jgi:O-antigen ligase